MFIEIEKTKFKSRNIIRNKEDDKINFFEAVIKELQANIQQEKLNYFINYSAAQNKQNLAMARSIFNSNKKNYPLKKQHEIKSEEKIQSPLDTNPFIFLQEEADHLKGFTFRKSQNNQSDDLIRDINCNKTQKSLKAGNNKVYQLFFDNKKTLDLDRKLQATYKNCLENKFMSIDPLYSFKHNKLKRTAKLQLKKPLLFSQRSERTKKKLNRFVTQGNDSTIPLDYVPNSYIEPIKKIKNGQLLLQSGSKFRSACMTSYRIR